MGKKDAEIEALRKQIEKMSAQFTAEKTQHQQQRTFTPEDLTEFQTRKVYIDTDLKTMGWNFNGIDVQEEFPVDGMGGIPGQTGYVDYVLFGRDGLPLAVVEAKRSSKDLYRPQAGYTVRRLPGAAVWATSYDLYHQRLKDLFLGRPERPPAGGVLRFQPGRFTEVDESQAGPQGFTDCFN